jgi:hypothetical protein
MWLCTVGRSASVEAAASFVNILGGIAKQKQLYIFFILIFETLSGKPGSASPFALNSGRHQEYKTPTKNVCKYRAQFL